MEIRCPICDQPVVDYACDDYNGVLHSESYRCNQPSHNYEYEFMTGGAREFIKTDSIDVMVMSHYTDKLDIMKEKQAILKHAIQLAKKEHTKDVQGKD